MMILSEHIELTKRMPNRAESEQRLLRRFSYRFEFAHKLQIRIDGDFEIRQMLELVFSDYSLSAGAASAQVLQRFKFAQQDELAGLMVKRTNSLPL